MLHLHFSTFPLVDFNSYTPLPMFRLMMYGPNQLSHSFPPLRCFCLVFSISTNTPGCSSYIQSCILKMLERNIAYLYFMKLVIILFLPFLRRCNISHCFNLDISLNLQHSFNIGINISHGCFNVLRFGQNATSQGNFQLRARV